MVVGEKKLGPAWCHILRATKTERNHYRRSVPNAINAFESCIEGETATIPKEARQSDPPARQCSTTRRGTGKKILKNTEMGSLAPPAILP